MTIIFIAGQGQIDRVEWLRAIHILVAGEAGRGALPDPGLSFLLSFPCSADRKQDRPP